MNRLNALWKKDPGLVVSGGAHLLALVVLLADFSRAPVLDEPEPVAVEMVTTSELNQVMQGEESAKQLPTPQRRVDKVAALEEKLASLAQTTAEGEAMRDALAAEVAAALDIASERIELVARDLNEAGRG